MQRYGLRHLAADVEAVVRRQSPAGLVIVGHSLGAEVGIEVANALDRHARGLVLVDGGPEMDGQAARVIHESLELMPRYFYSAFELASLLAERHPLAEERLLVEYAHASLRPARNRDGFELKSDPHFGRGMRVYDSGALRRKLLLTTCRKLLIRGALSAVWRQGSVTALAAELGCSMHTVPRAGHAIPLENPASLTDLLIDFVAM
jgi:pimeloyl-ACP methyl ester carboxylesterase